MLYKKLDDIVMHVFIIIFLLGWGEVGGKGRGDWCYPIKYMRLGYKQIHEMVLTEIWKNIQYLWQYMGYPR